LSSTAVKENNIDKGLEISFPTHVNDLSSKCSKVCT